MHASGRGKENKSIFIAVFLKLLTFESPNEIWLWITEVER